MSGATDAQILLSVLAHHVSAAFARFQADHAFHSKMRVFLAAALLALVAVSFACATESHSEKDTEVEWIQPSFVEEMGMSTTSAWDALVARAYAVEPSPHSFLEASSGVEAKLAATITAAGKSEAALLTEVELRGPNLWAEWKARFANKPHVVIDNDAKRFNVFMENLLIIAKKNSQSVFSHMPAHLRAVFSHNGPFAHLTTAEFMKLNKYHPVRRSARRSLIQVDAGADVDIQTDLEADSETDSEQAAENALAAEEDDALLLETDAGLPVAGQQCGTGGTCTAHEQSCTLPRYIERGLCAGTAVCCQGMAPSTPAKPTTPSKPALTVAPDCDWRSKGTPIKMQGYVCGCCFAFASAAALESMWNIKHGKLMTLSPQQIMVCEIGSNVDVENLFPD